MKYLIDLIVTILMVVLWIAGTVLAHGGWGKMVAVFVPPYAWYLVVERVMLIAGWIGA